MLALILVMYGFATLDWAIDVRRVWTDLKISIPAELSSPLHNESVLNTENTVLHIIQSTTNNISVSHPCLHRGALQVSTFLLGCNWRYHNLLESVRGLRMEKTRHCYRHFLMVSYG